MAYTRSYPDGYKDLPDLSTPVTAEVMENIEEGIGNLDTGKADKTELNSKCNITGWDSGNVTLIYVSTDGPIVTVSTSRDLTLTNWVGQKIRYTQGGVIKYGFLHALTTTTATIYGGTDYTLTNTTISDVYFSMQKAPYGFPMDPVKWSITITAAGGNMTNPVATTIYYSQFGSVNIQVPIGSWNLSYALTQGANRTTSSDVDIVAGLSTSSTAIANAITTRAYTLGLNITVDMNKNKPITVATKTPYYLIAYTNMASIAKISVSTITITCVCAYL